MRTVQRVRRIATGLGLVAFDGHLKQIDSLGMIDLVVRLERTFAIAIPPDEVTRERFDSVESIAVLVDGLQDSSSNRVLHHA